MPGRRPATRRRGSTSGSLASLVQAILDLTKVRLDSDGRLLQLS
jgi:hypothetical protein